MDEFSWWGYRSNLCKLRYWLRQSVWKNMVRWALPTLGVVVVTLTSFRKCRNVSRSSVFHNHIVVDGHRLIIVNDNNFLAIETSMRNRGCPFPRTEPICRCQISIFLQNERFKGLLIIRYDFGGAGYGCLGLWRTCLRWRLRFHFAKEVSEERTWFFLGLLFFLFFLCFRELLFSQLLLLSIAFSSIRTLYMDIVINPPLPPSQGLPVSSVSLDSAYWDL